MIRRAFRPEVVTGVQGAAAIGSYDAGWFSYSSSIDDCRILRARYCRNLGFTKTKTLRLGHGWTQNAAVFTSTDLEQLADLGFCVIVPSLRNRDGSNGSEDGLGREQLDARDAIQAARASIPGMDQVCAINMGLSGGAAAVCADLSKTPFFYNGSVSYFAFTDPGVDAVHGWYQQGAGGSTSSLDAWIGNHAANPDAYRARNAVESLATWPGHASDIWLYHDTGDGTVNADHSQRASAALTAAGIAHTYHESTVGSPRRWTHGLPHENADIPATYDDSVLGWASAAKVLAPRTCPITGSGRVIGYVDASYINPSTARMVTPFEVWLGEAQSPSPRAAGLSVVAQNMVGGTRGVADISWDLVAGTVTVTVLNGSRWVEVIMGSKRIVAFVTGTSILTPT